MTPINDPEVIGVYQRSDPNWLNWSIWETDAILMKLNFFLRSWARIQSICYFLGAWFSHKENYGETLGFPIKRGWLIWVSHYKLSL